MRTPLIWVFSSMRILLMILVTRFYGLLATLSKKFLNSKFESLTFNSQNLNSFAFNTQDLTNTQTSYQVNDFLYCWLGNQVGNYLYSNSSVYNGLVPFPVSDVFGLCQDQNFLKYFIDMDKVTCVRTFVKTALKPYINVFFISGYS